MPTLADIYSAIDSAKRKGSDLIRNPGASLQQIAGYGIDRANAARDALYQATEEEGIGYGPKTQALAKQMAESYNPIGMITWHGSPHVFEKFDLRKMGTGEGAQAYGKGSYLAQNPEVAQDYAQSVKANSDQLIKKAMSFGLSEDVASNLASALQSNKKFDAVLDSAKKLIDYPLASESQKNAAKNLLDNEMIAYDVWNEWKKPGNLYKVDLPDTHIRRMLDWDEPLKNQPKQVRDLAKKLGMDMNDLGGDLLAKVGKDEVGKKTLEEAGIRGIKYLDQMSRDKKTGTRNFVVFDPNHLTILERNNEKIK